MIGVIPELAVQWSPNWPRAEGCIIDGPHHQMQRVESLPGQAIFYCTNCFGHVTEPEIPALQYEITRAQALRVYGAN